MGPLALSPGRPGERPPGPAGTASAGPRSIGPEWLAAVAARKAAASSADGPALAAARPAGPGR